VDFQVIYQLFGVEIFDSGFIAIERLSIRIDNPAEAAVEIQAVITESTPLILETFADDNEPVVDKLFTE
jgi:hypothetical protein